MRHPCFSGFAENDLVVFATPAVGQVTEWVWRYVGKLAEHEEALELGGVGLTQVDIVQDWTGQWLAVITPEDWSDTENDFIHYGCRVVEIENMTAPFFSRDRSGNLKVRAVITASDQDRIGPRPAAIVPFLKPAFSSDAVIKVPASCRSSSTPPVFIPEKTRNETKWSALRLYRQLREKKEGRISGSMNGQMNIYCKSLNKPAGVKRNLD